MTRGALGLVASNDAWRPLLSFGEVTHCKGEPHINEAAAMGLVPSRHRLRQSRPASRWALGSLA